MNELEVYHYFNGYFDGVNDIPRKITFDSYLIGYEDAEGDRAVEQVMLIDNSATHFIGATRVILTVRRIMGIDSIYLSDPEPTVRYWGDLVKKWYWVDKPAFASQYKGMWEPYSPTA